MKKITKKQRIITELAAREIWRRHYLAAVTGLAANPELWQRYTNGDHTKYADKISSIALYLADTGNICDDAFRDGNFPSLPDEEVIARGKFDYGTIEVTEGDE